MNLKSERLKKLETELEDLQKWLNLGLVPKKDTEKHKEEIRISCEILLKEKGYKDVKIKVSEIPYRGF